jgi:hypothetical protein
VRCSFIAICTFQSGEDFIVKAKGFSYDTTATDLAQFFAGCDIKDGKSHGIHFLFSRGGELLLSFSASSFYCHLD